MPKTTNPLAKKSAFSINVILTLIVVVAAAVVIGGVLVFNGNGGKNSAAVLRRPDSNTLSVAPDNRVTLVEFLDYQCPACHNYYAGITKKLEQDYQGRITF